MGKLGYSTYTLTDLTETLPISLVLETNKEQNIQTKEGEFYTPNFDPKTGGEELIITPSLFLGSIERDVPTDYTGGSYIYYETGEMEELEDGSIHEKQYYYYKDNESEEIYVDIEGRLHYKKNLTENLTIEAYIVGFKNKVDQDYITSELVRAQNPITMLLLEQGKGIYTLVISSEGNREHFEENNKEEIKLTATLYKGAEPLFDEVEYEWDIVTDSDTEDNTNDDYGNGVQKDESKTDFISYGQEITIQRADVDNIQVYQCTATFNGLEFSSQKIIRDFTDGYTNQLIADSSLILTPNKTTVTLTNQVWYQAQIINGKDADSNRFNYKWILLKSDNKTEIVLKEGKDKELIINLNAEKEVENEETGKIEKIKIYPKENFSILGMVTIDGKTVTVNYADIKYQPIAYSVNVSPKTIFIPATSEGKYQGIEPFTQQIKFQLLDDNKQPLDYSNIDSFPDPQQNISVVSQTPGKWDFTLEFNLKDFTGWEENQSSGTYEFDYTYLSQPFKEEFEVVKNYAGADGDQGFSGYTIDLSNEFHAFAGGEMRADSDQSTSCLVSAYFGDTVQEIKKITLGSSNGDTIYEKVEEEVSSSEIQYKIPGEKNGYLFISSSEGENSEGVNIHIRTNSSTIDKEKDLFLTGIEPIKFFITIQGQKSELTFFKTFTYTINYNGKSYELRLSDNNIKYSEPTNTYSPNQITISALCRETNGVAQVYSGGKIIYSIDKGKSWKYYENSPIITNNSNTKLESIMVRLYSTLAKEITSSATLNESLLNENSKYLLDTETIPILTSMEGYEFGGENLIRWSKELPIEKNKWVASNNLLTIGQDGDFSTLDFNIIYSNEETEEEKPEWINFKTPKIKLESEYIGKTFCFSCYIYSDDWTTINPGTNEVPKYWSIGVIASQDYEGNTRDRYGSLIRINNGGPMEGYKPNYEKWETGKWIRIYKTFVLDEKFLYQTDSTEIDDNGEIIIPSLISCQYFNLNFYLGESGVLRVKKPKLELGNIPTEWNSSPYDIEAILENHYNTVFSSGNLTIDNDMKYYDLAITLQEEQIYCLSYSSYNTTLDSSNNVNNVAWELLYSYEGQEYISNTGEFSGGQALKDFLIIPKLKEEHKDLNLNLNYTFRIYATTKDFNYDNSITTTFKNIKLEKGSYSTSFYKTTEELLELGEDFFNASQNYTDELNSGLNLRITDVEGNQINFASKDDFEDYVSKLGKLETTVGNNKMALESSITDLDSEFKEVKSHIKLGVITEEEASAQLVKNTPYLALIVDSSSQVESNISMRLTNDRLTFFETKTKKELAYFSNNKLYVKSLEVQEDFRIGNSTDGFLQFSVLNTGIAFQWFE